MTEIKLYKSNWKGIKLIALTLPFVIIGILMISKEPNGTSDFYIAWFSTIFFALGIPIGIFTLFDKRPQIIINEIGIFDRSLKQSIIKWEQIIVSYPIDIYDQKFISIVVDETFEFKKRQYKWSEKLNKLVGVQNLNLNLSQIKIDENKLSELINKITSSERNQRLNYIRAFSNHQKLTPNFEYQNLVLYLLILIVFVIISFNSYIAFISLIILMGVSALITKWQTGTNKKTKLYQYAKITTILSFSNMVVLLLMFEIYDSTSNKIGIKITHEIENYRRNFGKYPKEINSICDKLNLNFFQNYLAKKIEYKNKGNKYKLEIESLYHNKKVFDNEQMEWN
jgi:hypothetical protein